MEYLNGEFLRIPLCWEDESETLSFGTAEGGMPVSACLRIRLFRSDGRTEERQVRYTGSGLALRF